MMRRNKLVAMMIAGLGAVVWAGAALAAPTDVTRAPDGELRFCREGYACTARAIGDFNGDGADDIVFELAARDEAESVMGSLIFGVPVRRTFELHLSPFRTVGPTGAGVVSERAATKRVMLIIDTAQAVDALAARDVDGDGIDDLVLARVPQPALIVLRGRSSWNASYALNRPTAGDIRVDLAELDEVSGSQTVMLSSEAADVNADGRVDLVIGRDAVAGGARQSEAYVLLGDGAWPARPPFEPATRVLGIGGCTQGLAGAADVTGDGVADVVLRRCVAKGQPTQLRVLPGRASWPSTLSAENVPDIVPPPEPEPEPQLPPGGGYLPDVPQLPLAMPDQFVMQDVNGDGLNDLGIEFAGKTHLFYGGVDIVGRTQKNRTSGVFLRSGYSAMPLTHTWRMLDLNADGRRDLLLSQSIDASLLLCPAGGCDSIATPPAGQPVYVFTGTQMQRRVIDPRMDAPDVLWNSPGAVIWGTGDFGGDGRPDLLLGSPPGAFDSVYTLVFGPLAGGTTGRLNGRSPAPGAGGPVER